MTQESDVFIKGVFISEGENNTGAFIARKYTDGESDELIKKITIHLLTEEQIPYNHPFKLYSNNEDNYKVDLYITQIEVF